jgi:hypothetical protein
MEVRNVRWVGVHTHHYGEMVSLLRDTMGPDPYSEFFKEHAAGPVPLFEVDNVHLARSELMDAGIEILGPVGRDSNWEWIHFRAPDGNLYELASRLNEGIKE